MWHRSTKKDLLAARMQRYENFYDHFFKSIYLRFLNETEDASRAEKMTADVFVKFYRVLDDLPSEAIAEKWIQMTAAEHMKKIK